MRFRLRTLMVLLAVTPQKQSMWFVVFVFSILLVFVASWLRAIYFGLKAASHVKPEIDVWRDAPPFYRAGPWWLNNPLNHVLITAHLTGEGIKARRQFIYSGVFCLALLFLIVLVGLLSGHIP